MASTRKLARCEWIRSHLMKNWGGVPDAVEFTKGPVTDLPPDFRVLRFPPNGNRSMWTYATMCMSQPEDLNRTELHLFAPSRNDLIAELLVATAHYHRTGCQLSLGDSVNFGRPWWEGSLCDHGLISLPYLDGPTLEWLTLANERVRFLWLIPITSLEVQYKRIHGLEVLEGIFEKAKINYVDPLRPSVVTASFLQ
jgi:Suppressor of fused protein (SUFU)